MVYQKIISGERVAGYKFYDEFWYVIEWNKLTYIHYSHKIGHGHAHYSWYISSEILHPKFKVQFQTFVIEGTTPKSVPPEAD